jgi:hypothetical protein
MSDLNAVGDSTFVGKYCRRHQCKAEDFEKNLLRRCMYRVSSPLAALLWLFNPEFFRDDLDLIGEVKDTTTFAQVRDIVGFYRSEPGRKSFLRRWLRVRMSKTKLLTVASSLFHRDRAE